MSVIVKKRANRLGFEPRIEIGKRTVGAMVKPYVIAELGVNHDGDVAKALALTALAHEAGADAVKLQLFEAKRLMSRASVLAAYQAQAGETNPIEMLSRLELSLSEMAKVVQLAHRLGMHALVSVFSVELVEVAEQLPWDGYKTASPDIINKPLLEALAATGKPLIVSTGASTLDEVVRAAQWLSPIRERLAMLQCVSSYPTPAGSEALEGIASIAEATGLTVGYSDHTRGIKTGAQAVSLGATILEKHMTYDRGAAGPDHSASLLAGEMFTYKREADAAHAQRLEDGDVRTPNVAISSRGKVLLPIERDVRHVSRQSLVATRDLRAGEIVQRSDLTIKRPGTGLAPYMMDDVIGTRVRRDISEDFPLREEDIQRDT